jgi:LacI family transcriptional regulator
MKIKKEMGSFLIELFVAQSPCCKPSSVVIWLFILRKAFLMRKKYVKKIGQHAYKVILLMHIAHAYDRGILGGIAAYSRIHGPWMFYIEPENQLKTRNYLLRWGADGIIVQDSLFEKVEEFVPASTPLILIAGAKEIAKTTRSVIITNWEKTGRMAAEYFLDRGFKHFAFVSFKDMYWSRERCRYFHKRIDEAGFGNSFYEFSHKRSERVLAANLSQMANWLKSLPRQTGLMACNDDCARYVLEACKIAGIQIPENLAILGVDNDELSCSLSYPPLSSISLDTEKAGSTAAKLLHDMMDGKSAPAQEILIQPLKVISRQSTNVFAIEDNYVRESLRFIRENAKNVMCVQDVVDAVAFSQRSLDQRFRKILGHSVYAEIRRVRVNLIIQLLIETRSSILQIARELGYANIAHISRYFRTETGMSLLAYRKLFTENTPE